MCVQAHKLAMMLIIALSASNGQQILEANQALSLIDQGTEFKLANTIGNENLEAIIAKITKQIKFRFDERIAALEMDAINNEISKWRKAMSTLEKNSDSTAELPDLIHMTLSMVYVNDEKINSYIHVLKKNEESISGGSVSLNPAQKWKSAFKDLSDYLMKDQAFYSVLDVTFNALTQYKVQNQKSSPPSPCNLPTAGTNVDNSNFKMFVDSMSDFKIQGLNYMKNSILSNAQVTALNQALNYTLKQKLFMSCESKVIVLKANFIKFSDFLSPYGKMTSCDWRSKTLKIYALNAIFVDRDLNAVGAKLKLIIIAPRWEIIGTRKILLDGAAGESQRAAASGSDGRERAHGADGMPGNPGGPGGSFFGIGDTFVNSGNLIISASGGSGGAGQSGGNGGRGPNGAAGFVASNKGNCDIEETEKRGFTITRFHSWNSMNFKRYNFTQIRVNAKTGGTGGDGGKCGVGGLGGFNGKVSISTLGKTHGIKVELKKSSMGTPGVLGKPGMGGLAGSSYLFNCFPYRTRKDSALIYARNYTEHYRLYSNTIAPSGKTPSSCTTAQPKKPESLDISFDESAIFTEFTGFLIENMNGRLERRFAKKILSELGASTSMSGLFNTFGLINHLKMLTTWQMKNQNELLPFYDAFLNNIKTYTGNPKSTERTGEYKKVRSYLYTATLTQIFCLTEPDTDQIIDINGYFELVSKNVRTLRTFQDERNIEKVVDTLKTDFKGEIGQKIQDAKTLIGATITPEFKKIGSRVDVYISKLVKETIKLQNDSKQKKKELEGAKKEQEAAIRRELAAIEASRKELAIVRNQSFWSKVFGGIASFVCACLNFFAPIGNVVAAAVESGLAIGSAIDDRNKVTRDIEEINKSLRDLSKSIKSRKNEIVDLTKGIEDMDSKIEEFKELEDRIYGKLVPMIENMSNDLMKVANSLKSQSTVSLDVTNWQVQSTLRDMKLEIHLFTKRFLTDPYLQRSMEQIEETMTILIKIYDRIQDYVAQQTLASYMANLSTASFKQVVVSNPVLSRNFRELQVSIQSNILLRQYSSVINAFKQWIFPFADVFIKNFKIPKKLITTSTEMETMASIASTNVELIRSRIHKYKTTIQSFDTHIYLAQFQNSSKAIKPFFVWKNEEHRDIIKRLFSGETVLVKADITGSSSNKDAIKFNLIELGFKSNNQTIQAEINQALLNYAVEMTHLGNSYYRYNDQYFTIASSSQSMRYSFEKTASGKAMFYNNVYQKMISGDIILSPYTMWRLRLTRNQAYAFNSFDLLENFYDKVDLMLEGHGSFVQTRDTNFDVQSYYKIDKTIINSEN